MAKRMRRKLLGCLLAVLGAMPLVFEGAPALALNLMTWNIQGATNMRNGGEVGTWQFVIGTMRENDKQIAAIQEAGSPNEIERQLMGRAQPGTFQSITITDVPGLPAGFVIRRIMVRIQDDNYTIYVLNDTQNSNSKRVALVLRNVQGTNLRVVQIPGSPRPALGVEANGTTYYSVHSPAGSEGVAIDAGRTALFRFNSDDPAGNWVALGDWNVNIGSSDNPIPAETPAARTTPQAPFGTDISEREGIQVYRSDRNTINARRDGGPLRAIDFAFANYQFANTQGRVIGQPDPNFSSDHLPVNYDDTPLQGGGGSPPSPPGDDPSITIPDDFDLLDNQCVSIAARGNAISLGATLSAEDRGVLNPGEVISRFCLEDYGANGITNDYVLRANRFSGPTVQSNGPSVVLSKDEIDRYDVWIFRIEDGFVKLVNLATGRPLSIRGRGGVSNDGGDGSKLFDVTINQEPQPIRPLSMPEDL